ncbi:MAG: hypothetical protein WCN87_01500 [Chlamydiota bacterium]
MRSNFIKKHRFVAIRDDYQEWKSHSKSHHDGKSFILDPQDTSTLERFFDDNISFGPHGIVTPVKLAGQPLNASAGLVVVDTVAAVQDDCYYIDILKKAL